MPIFDYQCPHCAKVFERMTFNSQTPETKCPECGTVATKQMSATNFHLAPGGVGWASEGYSGAKNNHEPSGA